MPDNQRYLALDVFRGMTVCFMIIVNSPGSWHLAYAPLLHAKWHGFTPTDLVFPSFLFAVGNAMAFVMPKYEALGADIFWRKTIKRTFVIFLLGYLMYWFPFIREAQAGGLELKPFAETRILGVLQRIALCYFFASIVLYFGSKNFSIWFCIIALLSYWIFSYAYGDPNDPYSMVGNYGLKLDLILFCENHLYHGEGISFDPEGLWSTLPSIVNVIVGYWVGDYIRKNKSSYESIATLLIAGVVFIFAALVWDMSFPINKKLWTSSFVLLVGGISLALLALFYYIIDVLGYIKWSFFFRVIGMNSILIYMSGHFINWEYTTNAFFKWLGQLIGDPFNAVALAICFVVVKWAFLYFMYRKKVFLRV